MNQEQDKQNLEKSNFKCAKCEYYSPLGKDLQVINNHVLCSICATFAPEEAQQLLEYIKEKVEWQNIETFRKFNINKTSHAVHRRGMIDKSKQGKLMARPPFGYRVSKGQLIIDEDNRENIRLIFEEFVNGKSLNQISQTYGISVNGIKKILRNFTYLGKIKFAGQISQGNHQPLISSELFNSAQRRFESLNNKKKQTISQ